MGELNYNKKNYSEAAKYFYEACGMESPDGCHFSAFVTERGLGVEKNMRVAQRIYSKACDLGDKTSCNMSEQNKRTGTLPSKNSKKSSLNLSGNCFFGYEEACQNNDYAVNNNSDDNFPKIERSENKKQKLAKIPLCDSLGDTPCKDAKTAFVWSEKAEYRLNWNNAVAYCKNLNEGGHRWTLPTKEQLKTLMGQGQSKLGDKEWFWTSSSKDSDTAWTVIFTYGVSYSNKDSKGSVRCVSR